MVKPLFCSEQGQVPGHLKCFVDLTGAIQCGEYVESWETVSVSRRNLFQGVFFGLLRMKIPYERAETLSFFLPLSLSLSHTHFQLGRNIHVFLTTRRSVSHGCDQ